MPQIPEAPEGCILRHVSLPSRLPVETCGGLCILAGPACDALSPPHSSLRGASGHDRRGPEPIP
eukprot:2217331-Alexandrium_andersonii.AAC.1